jgi:hypothetical protein
LVIVLFFKIDFEPYLPFKYLVFHLKEEGLQEKKRLGKQSTLFAVYSCDYYYLTKHVQNEKTSTPSFFSISMRLLFFICSKTVQKSTQLWSLLLE